MTIVEPAEQHRCAPPKLRPKAEWRLAKPPLGFMSPKDRENAKPFPVPTEYPVGALWCCSCGSGWQNVEKPPPRYGYSPRGTYWVPLRWWQFRQKAALKAHKVQADHEQAVAIVASWSAP